MSTFRKLLVPRRTTTATETLAAITGVGRAFVDGVFKLTIHTAATDATDKIDITIQQSSDSSAYTPGWDEWAAFGQVLGDAADGTVEYIFWNRNVEPTDASRLAATALTARNVVQGPVAGDWRIVATVVSGNSPSFDWSLEVEGTVPAVSS